MAGPAQGAALAQAVLDELLDKHTFVLSATHFPALKSYALTREGARAASMLFDPQSKKPLFRLAYDQVGASQALDVAREHGLAESIVRRAEHYLLQDGQDATALLGRLNDLAARREDELTELKREQEKTRRQTQDMRDKFEKERIRLHDEVRTRAGELMRAWKEGRATHKQALKEMSRLRASLAPAQDAAAEGQSAMCSTAMHGKGRRFDMRRLRIIERTALAWGVPTAMHRMLRPAGHVGQAGKEVSGSDAGRDSHAKGSAGQGADFGTHQRSEK